jgi:hypothetical protein
VPSPLGQAVTRAAYAVSQLPRVAWYLGHSLLLRELSQVAREREDPDTARRVHTGAPVPDRERIYADMAKVFLQDLANVEAGIYPIPADHDGSLLALIHRSRIFLDDLPSIHRRRKRRAYNEVLNETSRGKRPRYLSAEFPLSIWRLADGEIGRAVRHSGRDGFQRFGEHDQATGIATTPRGICRTGPTQAECYRYWLWYRTIYRCAQAGLAEASRPRGRYVRGLRQTRKPPFAALVASAP